jgi:DNA-binding transcriptional regulator YbjK
VPEKPSPRRRQLLEAALHVVADGGLRGLTHRAVDRRAGLPEGTCSAYLRTRQALQHALAEHVAGTLADDVRSLAEELRGCPGDRERVVAATRSLFSRWLAERDLLVAKLELSLQATRDPHLASVLLASRTSLTAVVAGIDGRREPGGDGTGGEATSARAETLVGAFDGILMAALLKPPPERHEFLATAVVELLSALAPGAAGPDGPT